MEYELSLLKLPPQIFNDVKEEIEKKEFFGEDPKKTFEIPKTTGGTREIALASQKTQIVQRILSSALVDMVNFSDHSYAFRKGKSPYKAVMRVRDYLTRGYHYIAKADIEKFFDHIDHVILMQKLSLLIDDKKILELIGYYLSLGYLKKNHWIDKNEGVYQGDVFSPILSNIYLNEFDFYLEREGIAFVRYSDDLVFFAESQEAVSKARKKASNYLEKLKLHFNPHKTYLSTLDNGFEYLGIFFKENRMSIDAERLAQKIEILKSQTIKLSLEESIEKLNETIRGFSNYYHKIVDDASQIEMLQHAQDEILVDKIIKAKQKGTHPSKQKLTTTLEHAESYISQNRRHWIERLIQTAYTQVAIDKPLESAQKRVQLEKTKFLQKQIKSEELVISQSGAFLGFSQGKLKVKIAGKVVAEAPIHHIKRILLLNKQTSLSTYVAYMCAKHKIDIDFIDHNIPYGLFTSFYHVVSDLHQAQLSLTFSPRGLEMAKEIAYSKALNQINLLKYHNRHRNTDELKEHIIAMKALLPKIQTAKEKKVLMGFEGNISVHYWDAFGKIIGEEHFIRTHQESKDTINQALNYGYAILYNRVQSALIREGLNLHYPLYHQMQHNHPTLVYDMVEEFRQPIVDREIIAIFNHGQKITQSNGRLSDGSIKIIIQHIQERLATPTLSRFGKTPFYNIIPYQMNLLKHAILEQKHYHGFVNRY